MILLSSKELIFQCTKVNFEYRYMLDFLFDVHYVKESNDRAIIISRLYLELHLDRTILTEITQTFAQNILYPY